MVGCATSPHQDSSEDRKASFPAKYEDEVKVSSERIVQQPEIALVAKGSPPPVRFANGFKVPPVGRLYADRTIDSPSTCELHQVVMKRESVAVLASGILDFRFKGTPYPHGGQPIGSGCMGPGNGPAYGYVWVCSECERAWEKVGRVR